MRIIGIIVMLFFGYLIIHFGFSESNIYRVIYWKVKVIHLLYLLLIFAGFYILTVIISLLGIARVEIDITTNVITLKSLISRKVIATADIKGYIKTLHKNRLKVFYGLLLRLENDKTIQLTEQNLKSLQSFRDFLVQKNIVCLGEGRMKFPFN